MNAKVFLVLLLALLVICSTFASAARPSNSESKKAAILRQFARQAFGGASDRQIVKAMFPTVRLAKKKVIVREQADASDCYRYCMGSTGAYKVSCMQHCQRYGL